MKVRIISAIVAFAILIPIMCLGGIPFAIAMGILGILGYKEILDLKKSHQDFPNVIKVLGLLSLIYLIIGTYGINSLDFAVSFPKILLPFILVLLPTIFYSNDKYTTKDAFFLLGTIYLLGLFFDLIIIIRNINLYLLIYLLSVTIITDTFAYVVGCLIGKHKMSPKISPKKSWEGFVAGLIGGVTISLIVYCNLLGKFNFKILLVTIILSVIGQFGDLVFSKIKRENNIKDFSNIMPGHGGILDRFDSLIFVVFTYVILLWFL